GRLGRGHIPKPDLAIIPGAGDRSQRPAVGGEGETDHIPWVASEWAAHLPVLRVPQEDRSVPPTGRQPPAVRREGYRQRPLGVLRPFPYRLQLNVLELWNRILRHSVVLSGSGRKPKPEPQSQKQGPRGGTDQDGPAAAPAARGQGRRTARVHGPQ